MVKKCSGVWYLEVLRRLAASSGKRAGSAVCTARPQKLLICPGMVAETRCILTETTTLKQ